MSEYKTYIKLLCGTELRCRLTAPAFPVQSELVVFASSPCVDFLQIPTGMPVDGLATLCTVSCNTVIPSTMYSRLAQSVPGMCSGSVMTLTEIK